MKKILKDNVWNRIFCSKTIEIQRSKYDKCKRISGFFQELYERIQDSKDLVELLNLHKEAWQKGFQNENLAPCEYGIFRTKNILQMVTSEVYLGNIYGLWTNNIDEWENHRNEIMGVNGFGIDESVLVYDIIVKQYKTLLLKNLNLIKSEAQDYVYNYEKINKPENPFKMF